MVHLWMDYFRNILTFSDKIQSDRPIKPKPTKTIVELWGKHKSACNFVDCDHRRRRRRRRQWATWERSMLIACANHEQFVKANSQLINIIHTAEKKCGHGMLQSQSIARHFGCACVSYSWSMNRLRIKSPCEVSVECWNFSLRWLNLFVSFRNSMFNCCCVCVFFRLCSFINFYFSFFCVCIEYILFTWYMGPICVLHAWFLHGIRL